MVELQWTNLNSVHCTLVLNWSDHIWPTPRCVIDYVYGTARRSPRLIEILINHVDCSFLAGQFVSMPIFRISTGAVEHCTVSWSQSLRISKGGHPVGRYMPICSQIQDGVSFFPPYSTSAFSPSSKFLSDPSLNYSMPLCFLLSLPAYSGSRSLRRA